MKATLSYASTKYDIKYNIDRAGADLPGMPITMDCGADPTDCAFLCAARSNCRSWAASTCGGAQHCWLKSGIPNERAAGCRVSLIYFSKLFVIINSLNSHRFLVSSLAKRVTVEKNSSNANIKN